MSNPSLPIVPMAATASPLRRRARDHPDDDVEDALELEEGELRGHESFDSDDSTQDDDDDDGGRYLPFQPRVEYDDYAPEARRLRLQHHRSPPRRRRLLHELDALDILLLGPDGVAALLLPSPTPPSGECESDATLSDDDHHHGNPTGSSSSAAGNSSSAAVGRGRGRAATGKRGWKAGGRYHRRRVVLSDSDSDLNTISSDGEGQAGTTASSSSAQAAPTAVHHQQPPPLPQQAAQPRRAPRPRRERATEYTCKVCGKSYATNQALGGHAAGHKNKQRRAAAMAAALVAAVPETVAGGAAFPFPLGRGGGKADEPHECRKCGKVFASGVALGGHMRVHYTGAPIVPATRKNKKMCLAPPPPPTPAEGGIVAAAPPVGLSLALSIKAEENIAAAPPVGLVPVPSIKAEEEAPSTPPHAVPAGGAVRVMRLFGIDISPQVQAPAPWQQQGSGDTVEDSSSTSQQQH